MIEYNPVHNVNLPCPWCHSRELLELRACPDSDSQGEEVVSIICLGCSASGPTVVVPKDMPLSEKISRAVAAWDNRP